MRANCHGSSLNLPLLHYRCILPSSAESVVKWKLLNVLSEGSGQNGGLIIRNIEDFVRCDVDLFCSESVTIFATCSFASLSGI